MTTASVKPWILPTIVFAQFCCTSLWFAGNAVMNDLVATFCLADGALGALTSSVQLGFIVGTLVFAFLTIADRFPPSRVFFVCAVLGGAFNLGALYPDSSLGSLVAVRFLTGFCLAGIYPVGMKIAADYYEKGLGKSLGFLVGALVLGTAFPHLLKSIGGDWPWRVVIGLTSGIAGLGGILMLILVPNGPFRRPGQRPDLTALFKVFRSPAFRAAAFGYFGHMWELYAFWAFVPVMLVTFQQLNPGISLGISEISFAVIAIGSLTCVVGGLLSVRIGPKRPALAALSLSGICCLLSPLAMGSGSWPLFLAFLLVWGGAVIMDSPLVSTLVARNAPPEHKGTALTIVNSLGFAITIGSIQLLGWMEGQGYGTWMYVVLAAGPILGTLALGRHRGQG